jgi:uncharacterized protein
VVLNLPARARRAVPWKNGGGVTREVAAHPAGSDLVSFDWRISIAEVRSAGPFSAFPGIERHMAVLQGELSLAIAGAVPNVVSGQSAPLIFGGEVEVHAEPLGAPVTDLNLMVRRARARGRLARCVVSGSQRLPLSATTTVIIAVSDLTLSAAGAELVLAREDAARLEGIDACELRAAAGAQAYLAEIWTTPVT